MLETMCMRSLAKLLNFFKLAILNRFSWPRESSTPDIVNNKQKSRNINKLSYLILKTNKIPYSILLESSSSSMTMKASSSIDLN